MSSAAMTNDDGLLLGLQGVSTAAEERERGVLTLLDLLTAKMNGVDRQRGRWESLKLRLGLKNMKCCGPAPWDYPSSSSSSPGRFSAQDDVVVLHVQHDEALEEQAAQQRLERAVARSSGEFHVPLYASQVPASPSGVNLATALAAERQLRLAATAPEGEDGVVDPIALSSPPTPHRMSLMRLLAETADGADEERERDGVGADSVCCVCMERTKGAAFIPCGHTFCRACSRELWLSRGTCPLCNRLILQILDIF